MNKNKIFVAGHNGMVGSAIVRALLPDERNQIITKSRAELDLTNQAAVNEFFSHTRVDTVYLAAAKVGGINANNTYPADFIQENLLIQSNLISAAKQASVERLLFLGSSCIYPKFADQPIKEEALLTGTLEPTNEPYAIAKIAGIKQCESYNRQYDTDFRSAMPTNLYGPGDNYHLENSHVIPALIRKFHEAKVKGSPEVVVWGTGQARREFLHVDDLATAAIQLLEVSKTDYWSKVEPKLSHINVGTGEDITIRELAETIGEVTDFNGDIKFDSTKPDGTPRKLLDVSKLKSMGWSPQFTLATGLKDAYSWFTQNIESARK